MNLTISGFSTALYATWFFVDDLALLLDCGDGASAGLLQKSRKVRTIAISHSDRDHLNGLPQFLQLNAREKGLPVVLYPRDCGSFGNLRDFLHEFDRRGLKASEGNRWEGMASAATWPLGKAKAVLEALPNRHIECEPGLIKSLSYRIFADHHRLRPEFAGRGEAEIAAARKRYGDSAVMISDRDTLLTYSADSPIESPDFWGKTRILIHESTFLHKEDAVSHNQEMRHSALNQVLPMACEVVSEALILSHFSTRYSNRRILSEIRRECRRLRPRFPVFAVLPGTIHRDILNERPAWEG